MARRSNARAVDPFTDLAAQVEILERELAVQRQALQRLKDMGRATSADDDAARGTAARTSA